MKLLINLFGEATLQNMGLKSVGLKPRWTLSLAETAQKRIKESILSGELLVKRGEMPHVPSWAVPV